MNFFDRELIEPSVHCFAQCYMCKRLVRIPPAQNGMDLSSRDCPHCGVHLTQQQIISTLVTNILHTQAVISAKKIAGMDPAALITVAVSVLLLWIGAYPVWFRAINVVIYVMPLVLISRWFRKYWWSVRFSDEEYIDSVRHMKLSLLLWLSTDILNSALLLFRSSETCVTANSFLTLIHAPAC